MELTRPPAPGDLLVASVLLRDGVFDQTVVLLLDHDDSGTLGVVLNKKALIDVADVLPQWVPLLSVPYALHSGGPVSPNGAICLASLPDGTPEPPGWRRLFVNIGLLHLDTPTELVEGAFLDLRVFAGYSGWEPRQLDRELEQGAWHLVSADYEDVFGADPWSLWRRVLHRQGGETGFFATWTAEPGLN